MAVAVVGHIKWKKAREKTIAKNLAAKVIPAKNKMAAAAIVAIKVAGASALLPVRTA